MSGEPFSRLERLLESTARKVSGGGLHPLEILQRVQEAVEGSARDGVVANEIVIALHPADYERYERSLVNLRMEIEMALDDMERRRRFSRVGERIIEFEASDAVSQAMPSVAVRFTDTNHRPLVEIPPGATRRITRIRGLALVLGDGTRVRLTHTPFTIGRGPGNDLVVPSLAMSRQHAQIVSTPGGLVMRDLGSRNGIVADGQRMTEVRLDPGMSVLLGDVTITVEALHG